MRTPPPASPPRPFRACGHVPTGIILELCSVLFLRENNTFWGEQNSKIVGNSYFNKKLRNYLCISVLCSWKGI